MTAGGKDNHNQDKKKPHSGAGDAMPSRDDAGPKSQIIDADVIEETAKPGPVPKKKTEKKAKDLKTDPNKPQDVKDKNSKQQSDKGINWAARTGWAVAFLLIAFLGGLLSEPYLRPSLIRFGLADLMTVAGQETADATAIISEADFARLHSRLEALEANSLASGGLEATETGSLLTASMLEALRSDVDRIDRQLGLLAAGPETTDGAGQASSLTLLKEDMSVLKATVDAVAEKISAENPALLEVMGAIRLADAERQALVNRINLLEADFEALEAGSIQSLPRGRLLLNLTSFRTDVLAGRSTVGVLSAIKSDIELLPESTRHRLLPAFANIAQLTARPVPTLSVVKATFDDAVERALIERDKEAGHFLAGLFTVRRTGSGATGLDRLVNQAEAFLAAGDVAGAIEATLDIKGAAGEVFTDWRAQAQKFVATQAGIDQLVRILAGDRL